MKLLKTLMLSKQSVRYPTLNGIGYKRMLKSFVKQRKNATLLLCNALISLSGTIIRGTPNAPKLGW
jgi:hypothetical protein